MKKIEIRPIQRKRWHGKKASESFTTAKKIQALVDPHTNEYATGLSEEDIKYLKEEKKVVYDLSAHFNAETPHIFWDSSTAIVKLENATMFLDIENPLDFIKSKICKASKYVANSLKEYEEGKYPEATHVIFDEAEEVKVVATKVAIKKRAVIESAKMNRDKKIQMILIMSGKNLKGQSDNFIEVELDKAIEKDARAVVNFIDRDEEDVYNHALVLEALQKSILVKDGHKIKYMDSVIGSDVFDVVQYFKDENNQDLKLRILEKVNV